MDQIISSISWALGGGVAGIILIEIVAFLITIWILYAVIKNAVKNAVIELRKEFNYTIRKALLESKVDIDTGIKEIPDVWSSSNEENIQNKQEQEEKAEWEYGKKMQREQAEGQDE